MLLLALLAGSAAGVARADGCWRWLLVLAHVLLNRAMCHYADLRCAMRKVY